MNNATAPLIQAVAVNHNTSPYTELLLRSLYARHSSTLNLTITVVDNASTDDMTSLRACSLRSKFPCSSRALTPRPSSIHMARSFSALSATIRAVITISS